MSKRTVQKVSIIMSIVVLIGGSLTFAMTWKNIGFTNDFLVSWLSSFALSVICIAPLGGIVSVLLNKMLNLLSSILSELKRNLVFGLCMALIMECVMATVTTINLHGYSSKEEFFVFWWPSLITALPIGIIFSIILTLIIKPRLELFWAK